MSIFDGFIHLKEAGTSNGTDKQHKPKEMIVKEANELFEFTSFHLRHNYFFGLVDVYSEHSQWLNFLNE